MNSFKGENEKKKKNFSQRNTSVDSQAFREVTFLFTREGMGKRMAPLETEEDVEIFEFCFN